MPDLPPLLIYGNGSTARLLYSFARRQRAIIGFTVDDAVLAGASQFCNLPIAAFSEVETAFPPASCEMLLAIGHVNMNRLRQTKRAEAKSKGYSIASFVHGGVLRHDGVAFGENAIVLDNSSIHPGCRIGAGAFICSNVSLGHDCTIGDDAWLSAGVALGGNCDIGEGAFFGVNACAPHGARIGARAYIGAGAVAPHAVPESTVWLAPRATNAKFDSDAFQRLTPRA